MILANNSIGLYNFRFELIQKLQKSNYEVYFSVPQNKDDQKVQLLIQSGAKYIHTPMNRRGMNPIEDLKLINLYKKIIKDINPDVILTYTIKPNIYGGILSRFMKIPYISNITGLGTAVDNKGVLQLITLLLYKIALKKAHCVFFKTKKIWNF